MFSLKRLKRKWAKLPETCYFIPIGCSFSIHFPFSLPNPNFKKMLKLQRLKRKWTKLPEPCYFIPISYSLLNGLSLLLPPLLSLSILLFQILILMRIYHCKGEHVNEQNSLSLVILYRLSVPTPLRVPSPLSNPSSGICYNLKVWNINERNSLSLVILYRWGCSLSSSQIRNQWDVITSKVET